MYPEAKIGRAAGCGTAGTSPLAYVLGFVVLLAVLGWHPTDKRGKSPVLHLALRNTP